MWEVCAFLIKNFIIIKKTCTYHIKKKKKITDTQLKPI
jgi:hypothetical protein